MLSHVLTKLGTQNHKHLFIHDDESSSSYSHRLSLFSLHINLMASKVSLISHYVTVILSFPITFLADFLKTYLSIIVF